MPSESRARDALYDIRDNILFARQFVEHCSYEEFLADRKTFYAATRALEIISEAVRRLPSEVLLRHRELPWRSIMDAGNVYRHTYDQVAEAEVWRTVQSSLAPLLEAVSQEIEALGEL